jgi:nucleoside-diphosphate-sugar epimerase
MNSSRQYKSAIMDNPLTSDLDYIFSRTKDLWEELRGKRIFVTGGTGFFGCWLLESFCWANRVLRLNAEAWVLTRNSDAFKKKCPHLANDTSVKLYRGNVIDFGFPSGKFPYIIHAATEASATLNEQNPLLMFDTIVAGTRRCLDFARQAGTKKFLLTSSGAVYGRQPPELSHVPEEYSGAPDTMNPHWIYGEGKRCAELLCSSYSQNYGIGTKIARCWAFVGPYLPLDIHFAIGNFIRDGLNSGPIKVTGDGAPIRSYQYAADLAIWLWTILYKGVPCRPYNTGSNQAVTIAEIAAAVAKHFQTVKVDIAKKPFLGALAERYVPATDRAREELGLINGVTLEQALGRTIAWNRHQKGLLHE